MSEARSKSEIIAGLAEEFEESERQASDRGKITTNRQANRYLPTQRIHIRRMHAFLFDCIALSLVVRQLGLPPK